MKDNSLKVSIIIPVYNASKTVKRLLDSIKIQTLTDFEALLIDDGSTDGSAIILDEYSAADNRFKVVHKQNGGVSAARQIGIELAKGEYVIHADSDDWVDQTMLEELYAKAENDDADVVICDFFSNTDTEQTLCKQQPSKLKAELVLRELFQQLHGSCCNKLVRRACYNKYNVRFPKGINHCEDLLFWVQLLQHTDVKVSYLPKAFYHYYNNVSSITRHYTRSTYEMRLKYVSKLNEVLSSDYKNEKKQAAFSVFTEAVMFNVLSNDEAKEGLIRFRNEIKNLESLKWKIGFFCLSMGFNRVASKLIHY